MSTISTVLLVDDEKSILSILKERLAGPDLRVICCGSAAEALEVVESEELHAVVTDVGMSGMNGIELCARIVADRPGLPVIVLTGRSRMDTAVAAIRAGAYDFVTKPVELETLVEIIQRAIRYRTIASDAKRVRAVAPETRRFEDIGGESPKMKKVFGLMTRVADLESSVLITGESGTGKELVALALHHHGRRRAGPFVAVNCAAISESLLESELFGHAKGAFTDAKGTRAGLFMQANGGTLFLDEVGEMSMAVQPKLLHAVQERTVRPVGSDKEVACDVRLIAATNRNLLASVAKGTFREDLFYRLEVITIEIPPLRQRPDDILLLAQRFVDEFAAQLGKRVVGLSPSVSGKLLEYGWPGNVRELRNCIERAVALTDFERVAVADLPERIQGYQKFQSFRVDASAPELIPITEIERRHVLRVLDATHGNKSSAAEILGINRRTLYRKLELYGIAPKEGDPEPGSEP